MANVFFQRKATPEAYCRGLRCKNLLAREVLTVLSFAVGVWASYQLDSVGSLVLLAELLALLLPKPRKARAFASGARSPVRHKHSNTEHKSLAPPLLLLLCSTSSSSSIPYVVVVSTIYW